MPDQPGANLLDVGLRAVEISCAVMVTRSQVGVGSGSSSWRVGMGLGSGGKNREAKAVAMSVGSAKRPEVVWMGGMWDWVRPLRHRAASHRFVRVASLRYS